MCGCSDKDNVSDIEEKGSMVIDMMEYSNIDDTLDSELDLKDGRR